MRGTGSSLTTAEASRSLPRQAPHRLLTTDATVRVCKGSLHELIAHHQGCMKVSLSALGRFLHGRRCGCDKRSPWEIRSRVMSKAVISRVCPRTCSKYWPEQTRREGWGWEREGVDGGVGLPGTIKRWPGPEPLCVFFFNHASSSQAIYNTRPFYLPGEAVVNKSCRAPLERRGLARLPSPSWRVPPEHTKTSARTWPYDVSTTLVIPVEMPDRILPITLRGLRTAKLIKGRV